MIRDKGFLVSLVVLAAAGAAVGLLREGTPEVRRLEYDASFRPTPQSATARTWREPAWSRTLTIPAGRTGSPLRLPLALDATPEGTVYVLDGELRQVLAFGPAGELTARLGTAGEGAMGFPTDLAVAPGGGVWVADPTTDRVLLFDPDGTLVRAVGTDRPSPTRVATLPASSADGPASLLALLHTDGADPVFQLVDSTGTAVGRFGTVLAGAEQNPLLVDGVVTADTGGFAYAGVNAGFLASFDRRGRSRFVVGTVEPLPLPGIETAGTGHRVETGSVAATLALAAVGDDLLLLTREHGGRRKAVIDVYSAADGTYRSSWHPPVSGGIRDLAIVGRTLLLATDDGVTVWRREGA